MFKIRITSLSDLQNDMVNYHPTKVISVFEGKIPYKIENHFQVKFDDIVEYDEQKIMPKWEHLQSVLKFTEDLSDDDRVLIHCVAGISRSPAIAIAILLQHGMNFSDAFFYAKTLRPQADPNELIIRYVDDHFALNGQLTDLVKLHQPYPNLVMLTRKS